MTNVKPLEWAAEDNGEFIAMSPVGWYHIGYPCRSWNLTMPSGEVPSFGDDLEAAKAAAFADYSARIMSAIEPAAQQCCMCGKKGLSTVEGDGGTECELSDGRWVCSAECWDRAVEPAGVGVETPPPSSHVAGFFGDLLMALSRLAGNRQKDGVSSTISREDRETIINGCHDLMIAVRQAPAPSDPSKEQIERAIEAYREGVYLTDEQVHASVTAIVRAALATTEGSNANT